MSDALCVYPGIGSVWLTRCKIVTVGGREFVEGEAWDKSDAGSPYMPDDYHGQYMTMNFPITCVRKWEPAPPAASRPLEERR